MPSVEQPVECFCDATRLSYLQFGGGPAAIVMLHGIGASKELWWSALHAFAPLGRLFALDLPGHGLSPLHGTPGMAQIAQRVAAFCAAHELTEITLIGHSMGGNIAVELTLTHPTLVRRLVLVDPAAHAAKLPIYTSSARIYSNYRRWAALRASMVIGQQIGRIGRWVPRTWRGGMLLPALRRASYLARHDVYAMNRELDHLLENPLLERLPAIHVPTLVLSGQFDPLVPPAHSRRVAAAIPGAQFALVPRAGHNPMDERPQVFEPLVLTFLQQMSSAA